MNIFKSIFGIDAGEIKEKCVLVPCLSKELLAAFGVEEPARGKIYGCAQGDGFTLIHARIGACFVGDLVLYLKETACAQVFLFGSCGSTSTLDVGRLVMPVKCLASESFSSLLYDPHQESWPVFYPDQCLVECFHEALKGIPVEKTVCMTLPSLKLEEGLMSQFHEHGVGVVDMECSAFFAAAAKVGLPAMGLFYVSDVLGKKPFFAEFTQSDKQALTSGMASGIKALCDFMKKSSNG